MVNVLECTDLWNLKSPKEINFPYMCVSPTSILTPHSYLDSRTLQGNVIDRDMPGDLPPFLLLDFLSVAYLPLPSIVHLKHAKLECLQGLENADRSYILCPSDVPLHSYQKDSLKVNFLTW